VGYTVLKNFERGIDARRLLDCTESGALIDAKDCHITRGGEMEKRAAFVVVETLPAGTIGFYAQDGAKFHVWGTAALPGPAGMPASVTYHSIPHEDGHALTAILSVDEFLSKLYVIARYANGDTLHWWDDVLIIEFVPGPVVIEGDDPDDPPIVVDPPPPSVPGAKPVCEFTFAFASSGGAHLYGFWLLAPGAPSSTAISLIPYTGLSSSGYPITDISIPRGDGSGSNIANTIMAQVNAYTSEPEFTAVAEGNKLVVTVQDASAKYNGWFVTIGSLNVKPNGGSINWSYLTGGKDPVLPTTVGLYGSKTPAPVPSATAGLVLGTFAVAHNRRMYTTDNTLLRFSMIDNPARYDTLNDTGGFIDHSTIANEKPILVSAADYQEGLAVFGLRHVFVWHTDPLPASFFKKQVLHNTGTASPHSVTPYSESEVMYLDRSGIRSLRSRSGVDTAYSGDLGNLIDRLVRAKMKSMTLEEKYEQVFGEVEPNSGRLWMAMKDVIYVLSYFPDTRIAGWTWYDNTAYPVDMLNANYEGIYWRSGNSIIAYGGLTGDVFDATEAVVRVPYIDGDKPATRKSWTGIDLAVLGTWQIKAGFDATVPTALDLIANLTKSTYAQQKISVNGDAPSMSLELRSDYLGPARVGNATVHYIDEDAD
jgi:hypothetical protein